MSQSQASENQYEASQYAESFIDPDLLQSDTLLNIPSSQVTTDSTPLSDFTYPPQYPRAPDSLVRVGKPLQQFYILYKNTPEDPKMETTRRDFVEWWLKTEYGLKQDLRKSIKWDSDQKKSEVWQSFNQVAYEKTGEPKVMCKRCHNVIVHPGNRRAGCSPMKAHLNSTICIKPRKLTRHGIDQLLRNSVSL